MNGSIKSIWENRRRTLWILALILVAVIVFAAFRLNDRGQVKYFTAKVEEGDIVQVVNSTGTIDAVTTVEVGSQVSGQIAELYADFNAVVHKGDIIARIDPDPFQARLLQVQADLASARANVKSLEADKASALANQKRAEAALREAELNLERSTELLEQGITSSQQHEAVKVAHETATANLEAARAQIDQIAARREQALAQVRQREASLEQVRLDLEHTIIRAPIDGTVINRSVDAGQTVAASFSAPTLFTIAQDLTQMLVYAKTDESDVGKIRRGAEVSFTVDSFPGESFQGRVKQVRMNATTVQNVVTYDTVIEFENQDLRLLPGMTAYVTIPVASAREVVKIPNGALRYQPNISEEERAVLFQQAGLDVTGRAQDREGGAASTETATNGEGGSGPPRGQRSDEERRQMRERFQNMSPEERARFRQQMMARRQGQGREDRAGARQPREQSAIVWKLTPQDTIRPVRIKTGLTDFTFTVQVEGELQPGDELVIGQTGGTSPGDGNGSNLRRMFRRF